MKCISGWHILRIVEKVWVQFVLIQTNEMLVYIRRISHVTDISTPSRCFYILKSIITFCQQFLGPPITFSFLTLLQIRNCFASSKVYYPLKIKKNIYIRSTCEKHWEDYTKYVVRSESLNYSNSFKHFMIYLEAS